ncbi:FAD-binding oxidoreductase [Mesorhizobium sp. M00.F.Ca.ET.151.01.1.1]|uniref:NAD(P)/FAD-dependent oxidoreductase n=1 Tax=unclassified Mesorhizobium TaxID=325217 RepID=UPI001091D6C8|nr:MULTISPECIES: FAD-dependent oxidoreductase [unclassified Mesorhizobium]TGU94291.1 FAD-binding oxidoreductase [Mesorhizobium sp. M00.F.Ca.ET.151.01.1.1]TGP92680.1 FAD-binding oxidoreductase [Mesorhizobium sp. M8A.F.Ca.ET.218.01.1.1]TGS42915.1 FAD-binding oxidoreductase [Mesorhizobium sp. M8A.F.Ca.ET.182.01.1.1]TGS79917.1 FAD-binding oxidoreductase [Mesorhizobium sp. M8A.F.Ca.ET.181.01.1.1]TGT17500.1 FAD-binding oxidoreductase [Mesorhizobium sp. M8A.F.Ca.ET.213.01.1.1]
MNAMVRQEAHGASLWHAVSHDRRQRPALNGDLDVDLAIVGGGFSGLSTALHAAGKGLSVAVLEAEIIAWGATGRNAGFVVPNFAKMDPDGILAHLGPERGERLIDFAAGSADLVFGLIRQHGIDCDAVQNGWIQPAHSPAALEKVKSRAGQWAQRGRPVVTLDRQDVATLTGARGYLGGWMDRSGGVLNPVAYARGLADAAEKAGARIFEQARVTSIDRVADGWALKTPSGSVRAARVLIATNAYGGSLDPLLQRTYFPLKVFQIATAPLPLEIRTRLLPGGQGVGDTRRNLFTFRFDADNRLISGGMHILSAGADRRVPQTIWRRLAARLDLPDLPPLVYGWSGMAAVEPDFLPHLLDLGPGLIAGRACNGRGIAMTTAMGKVLADWAAGTDARELPLPFAPPAPIPFHALLRHAPNMLLGWSMLRDRMDETA